MITFSGDYEDPVGSGNMRHTVSKEYGIVQEEFRYCPLMPSSEVRSVEYYMEAWPSAGHDFTQWIGYAWLVPRSAGLGGSSYEWPVGTGYATRIDSKGAGIKVLMADTIMSSSYSPDGGLPDDVPAGADLLTFYGNGTTFGTHLANGKISDTNLLYLDLHVENRRAENIKVRYGHRPGEVACQYNFY